MADFADARVQLHSEWMLPGARRQEQHHIFPLQVLALLQQLHWRAATFMLSDAFISGHERQQAGIP